MSILNSKIDNVCQGCHGVNQTENWVFLSYDPVRRLWLCKDCRKPKETHDDRAG